VSHLFPALGGTLMLHAALRQNLFFRRDAFSGRGLILKVGCAQATFSRSAWRLRP